MAEPLVKAVVFVNNFPGPGLGGGETQLLQLIGGCVEAGIDTRLVCADARGLAPAAARAGATVVVRPLGVRHVVGAVREVRRVARDAGDLRGDACAADAVIVQGTGYFTNLLTRLAGRRLAVGVVNLVHVEPRASLSDGGSRLGLYVRGVADRMTRGRVDAHVAVSEAVRDGLVAGGVEPSAVSVVHNGVDIDGLRAAAAGTAGAPCPGMPAGRPLVGVVARLEPVKGVADFVRAAARVATDFPEARFVVVGSGSQEGALRRLAADLGLGSAITWSGTVRPIEPFLAALDVVVLPSLSEGLPMVALEAMALARPLVATAVGGLPEVVVDGTTGLLVAAADHVALAQAIGTLLTDGERARAMGRAGAERVAERFTVGGMVGGYLELYGRLAAQGRRESAASARGSAV